MANALPSEDTLSWLENCIGLRDSTGAAVVRFKVEVKFSARERRWSTHAHIPVPPHVHRGGASDLLTRITHEVENSGASIARVCALLAGSKTPVATRPWETPLSDDDDDPTDFEATPGMLLGQTFRHNEVLLARLQTMAEAQIRTLGEQNKQLLDQQQRLMQDRLDLVETTRRLVLEQDEVDAKRARNTALVNSAETLVQTLAYKLTSGKVAPNARLDIIERMLVTLGRTFTPEQAEQLAAILTPEQLTALNSVTSDPLAKVQQIEEHRNAKASEEQDEPR